MAPIRIHIEDRYVRAVKVALAPLRPAATTPPPLKATFEAQAKGYDQVLWLDGKENKYVEEVGAMNMVFVMDGKLVTAPHRGQHPPGHHPEEHPAAGPGEGIPVEERPIAVEELFQAHAEGRLTEAFGTGTAAVISPWVSWPTGTGP